MLPLTHVILRVVPHAGESRPCWRLAQPPAPLSAVRPARKARHPRRTDAAPLFARRRSEHERAAPIGTSSKALVIEVCRNGSRRNGICTTQCLRWRCCRAFGRHGTAVQTRSSGSDAPPERFGARSNIGLTLTRVCLHSRAVLVQELL